MDVDFESEFLLQWEGKEVTSFPDPCVETCASLRAL